MGVGKSESAVWAGRAETEGARCSCSLQVPYGNLGEQLAQLQPKGPVLGKFLLFILGGLQLFA